jgi:hypothetical protein
MARRMRDQGGDAMITEGNSSEHAALSEGRMGLVRWSGLAAMVGAGLLMQGFLLHPETSPEGFASPMWTASHFGFFIGYLLVQLGLVGILARQLPALGRLGIVGFVVAFLGAGLSAMEARDHMFSMPMLRMAGLQSENPDALPGLWMLILGAALFSLGHILLGIATYRAGVLPQRAAALMAVGAPMLAFAPPIPVAAFGLVGVILYGSGLAWLGAALVGPRRPSSRQSRLQLVASSPARRPMAIPSQPHTTPLSMRLREQPSRIRAAAR